MCIDIAKPKRWQQYKYKLCYARRSEGARARLYSHTFSNCMLLERCPNKSQSKWLKLFDRHCSFVLVLFTNTHIHTTIHPYTRTHVPTLHVHTISFFSHSYRANEKKRQHEKVYPLWFMDAMHNFFQRFHQFFLSMHVFNFNLDARSGPMWITFTHFTIYYFMNHNCMCKAYLKWIQYIDRDIHLWELFIWIQHNKYLSNNSLLFFL